MAWTAADVTALKQAIATGVLSVAYADRTTTYRSMAEMTQILAMMEREVQGSAHTNHRLAAHSKGV